MIYLIDAEETARPGLLSRLRRMHSGGEGYRIADEIVLGMRIRRMTIESRRDMRPDRLNGNVGRAADALRRERAAHVIYSEGFEYRKLFEQEGFREVDDGALKAALAGRLAALAAGDGASAVLFAHQMSGCALNTLQELCRRFRCVMAVAGGGWSPALAALRRATGVSVIERPSARQLEAACVAVFYDAPPNGSVLPVGCVAIEARPGALRGVDFPRRVAGMALALSDGHETALPRGFPMAPLLASALDAGTIRPENISIRELSISEPHCRGT